MSHHKHNNHCGTALYYCPDNPDATEFIPTHYRLHYVSADAPGEGTGWSVYREEYLTADHDEPIDGLTVRLHSGLTEKGAYAEANALQEME